MAETCTRIRFFTIADFEEAGKTDPLFAKLDKICKAHRGLWNPEAEGYLLANAKAIGN